MAINAGSKPAGLSDSLIDDFIKVRKYKRMSQAELAKKSDLHQAAVGRIENKSTDPRLETLMKMINSMGYTLTIIPSFFEPEHATTLEINGVMESLSNESLKRIKAYADALYEEELKRKQEAFEKLMSLAKPMDIGDDYKAILEEELIRKYEGLD